VVALLAAVGPALGAPLGDWLAEHYKDEAAGLKPIVKKLARQSIKTTEQLMALGKDGVKKLHIPAKYRALLKDALVHHLGETSGFDDGKMVPVPKRKPKKKAVVDECGELSLLELEVAQSQSQSQELLSEATPLGKFLLSKYPDDKKKLQPIIKKLEGQMIWSFKDLGALGGDGIESITIPKKYRRVLKDALLTHIARKNSVSERLVPVPEGYHGLWKKKLAAARAARAKAKRCTQVRLQKKLHRQARKKKARKTRRHRGLKFKKCSVKGGCIGRRLPVLYYPIPHVQDLPPHVHEFTPEYRPRT